MDSMARLLARANFATLIINHPLSGCQASDQNVSHSEHTLAFTLSYRW
jgi:hypothetical protein